MANKINLFFAKYAQFFGVDRAVFFAISGKIWSMGAGLITSILIATFFSPEIQGYYYTFISVLALQIFAELGLSGVISAYASHEWVRLSLNEKRQVEGDKEAKSKLKSLGRFSRRWYLYTGLIATFGLSIGGLTFFGSTNWNHIWTWGPPWIMLCIVTGINLSCMPYWAILEGCNQVANLYRYRLIQAVTTGLIAWISIYLGAGLWVASIVGLTLAIVMLLTVGYKYKNFIHEIFYSHDGCIHLDWRKEILPMQWRISVSWLSGYFAFSLFVPVLFHYQGSIIAGQMGMTWSFIMALTGLVSSWVAPKAPIFAMLIAQNKYDELNQEFWRLTRIVICITSIGALTIWTVIYALNILNHPYAHRMLSPTSTGYFLLATILVAASLPMSTYLRAHKAEPLMWNSAISGIMNGAVIFFMGKYFSVEWLAFGYLISTILTIPFVVLIWYKFRIARHVLL
jgi:O-antigen/teichoic acid export membrane protein